jgi:ribosome-associated heat shock protein Hsp15
VSEPERARLDRWLWAARFFKTRSQAKQAIDGGKVEVEGARSKPAREIAIGTRLRVPRGPDRIDLVVTGLSERRGSAEEARLLYRETDVSVARRQRAAESRRLLRASFVAPPTRPERRDRRALGRLKQQSPESP